MKKLVLRSSLLLAATAMLAVTGCEKIVDDAAETTESAEDATSDMMVLSSITDGIQDMVEYDPNLQLKNGSFIIPREYFTYQGDDSVFTDNDGVTIEFDFEPNAADIYYSIIDNPQPGSGAVCSDGTTRWGSGTIYINNPIDQEGSKLTLELDRYIILKDGSLYQIDDGDKKDKEITLTRENGRWKLDYNLSFQSKALSEAEPSPRSFGKGTFFLSNKDGGQPGMADDEITVTGSSKNNSKKSKFYDVSIPADAPLFRKGDATCSKTFISGRIELKNEGSNFTIKADFGSGNCDNDVEVTLPGGVKKTITVK